jgi:WD40 repeat protein
MVPSILYCDACGAANRAQAKFCFVCGQALPNGTSSIEQLVPDTLLKQRYRVISQVGKGGFGAVYKAEDIELGNRIVAVKEMSQRGLSPQELIEATEAFKREALLLANLMHPNLPRIYEHFSETGRWYLVMDFIEGETLEEYLGGKSGRLPVEEVLDIGMQLCTVLDYLHTRQPPIIFRDLKPSNIIRTSTRHLYLVDFGIARHFKMGQAKDTIAFGSPGYAAPEQYGKAQTTPRSDIYSLGTALHQMLSGDDPSEKPFRFASLQRSGLTIPTLLGRLVMQMVEMDEDKRPPSMAGIKEELQRIATGVPGGQMTSTSFIHTSSTPPSPSVYTGLAPIGNVFCTYRVHSGSVRTISWSPDGTRIASAGNDGSVQVWDAHTGDTLFTCQGHTGRIRSVAWSPDGRFIASASEDRTVQIWNATTGRRTLTYQGHSHNVVSVTWSPDAKYIASASIDMTVQVWHAATGQVYLTYPEHSDVVDTVAWSPDGQYIASAGYDTTVQVWHAKTGRKVYIYDGHAALVHTVAWSPDSQYIASGGSYDVEVWNAITGDSMCSYREHNGLVYNVAWSPGGTRIVSCAGGNRVRIWDAKTATTIFTFGGHASEINTVAWSPDGTRIASGGNDKTVQVWMAE